MAKKTLLRRVMDLQSEAEAYALLEELRWRGTPYCPHCGSERVFYLAPKAPEGRKTRTGKVSERRVWKCGACRRQFSAMTGTIFHGSKVELKVWLAVVVEMCANKNGMAAREIERKYGVAPKTAWFMAHRVREAMKRRAPGSLVGTIVVDEAYIGGDPTRMNAKTRARWEGRDEDPKRVMPGTMPVRPNQRTAKTPVVSLIDAETGEVRSAVVPHVTGASLRKVIAEHVDMGRSVLWTDESSNYNQVGREFIDHLTVNHREEEYVGPMGQTINQAENFFSQLKRSIDGTHHRVSVEHLPRYLAEFDYRHSTRAISDDQRVARLMGQSDRRLSYKRTVS